MRGLRVEEFPPRVDAGIIPACAGFTKGQDPYLCLVEGSSPRARGLLGAALDADAGGGIIPACAGFTRASSAGGSGPPDHPRMRGVYRVGDRRSGVWRGSSPHARGLRRLLGRYPLLGRIIPACAGVTISPTAAPTRTPDHPRMRGVYTTPESSSSPKRGSSPHARGLHGRGDLRPRPGGIIPACAGFTVCGVHPRRDAADHPRMRGVYRAKTIAPMV